MKKYQEILALTASILVIVLVLGAFTVSLRIRFFNASIFLLEDPTTLLPCCR